MKALVWLVVGAVLGAALMRWAQSEAEPQATADTVRVVRTDTVRVLVPVVKDSVVVKEVVRRMPLAQETILNGNDDNFDTLRFARPPKNRGTVYDGNGNDSAEVVVPITQKVYEDSAYTAWVSGYEARLDSLWIRQRTETLKITSGEKPRKWSIGVGVGAGVTRNGRVEPMIGISLNYSIFSF
jgi:hypothetical protein